MKPLKLSLSMKNFEELHAAADGRGKFCKARKKDLINLLMDHSRALATLADMKVPLEESYAYCRQVREARRDGD